MAVPIAKSKINQIKRKALQQVIIEYLYLVVFVDCVLNVNIKNAHFKTKTNVKIMFMGAHRLGS